MKRHIVIAAVTATALLGGGAAVAFAGNDDDSRDEVRRTQITAADAAGAALKERPGTVVSVDLDDRDGDDARGWEVEVLGKGSTSYTVHVNPDNGRILGTDTDRDDEDGNDRGLPKGATVDAREAAGAAAAKGFVTSVDLDDDDRTAGWDVETVDSQGKESHWTVDPRTGKVAADRGDDDSED
ncbi:PepSY domain-containing protein [Streptomyces sp. enrichment culture]|uniref:PepSY domain-containing protein n=1 Tax=Streptomyces sp. enrichment culture TaxID=1795815 RepID=UPI003F5523AD